MVTYEERQACTRNSWYMAGLAGIIIAALLYFLGGWGAFQALFGGVVVFIILGALFIWAFCSKVETLSDSRISNANGAKGASQATATSTATTTGAVSGGAAGAAAAGTAAKSHSDTAAFEKDVSTAAPTAVDAAPSAAATSTTSMSGASAEKPGPRVTPSKKLAGQDSLAAKKGAWKYEAPATEASTDVTARSSLIGSVEPAATNNSGKTKAKAKPDAKGAKAKASGTAKPKAGGATAGAAAKTKANATKAKATDTAKPGASTPKAKATGATKASGAKPTASKSSGSGTAKRAPVAKDGKPEMLSAPRAGGKDDLKLISGVGPKLEATLNELGVWHFDQIANWRKKEIEWVDARLRFKGRIERDDWITQAKVLAKGGETEFSRRKKKT